MIKRKIKYCSECGWCIGKKRLECDRFIARIPVEKDTPACAAATEKEEK